MVMKSNSLTEKIQSRLIHDLSIMSAGYSGDGDDNKQGNEGNDNTNE